MFFAICYKNLLADNIFYIELETIYIYIYIYIKQRDFINVFNQEINPKDSHKTQTSMVTN